MPQNIETGKLGEDIACDFLKENGFLILLRNFREKWGEIDIIARDKDKTLVFVEVKTVRSHHSIEDPRCGPDKMLRILDAAMSHRDNAATIADLMPEDQMSRAKIKKFARTAELFANENEKLINKKAGWRLDFIGITFDDSVKPTIRHYKNIS
ncbi:MAG: YraN family protein [bacterium]|nr:YraN family protein [bacterium]